MNRAAWIRLRRWAHIFGMLFFVAGLVTIWRYTCWQVVLGAYLVILGRDLSAAARTMPIEEAQ